MSAALELGRGLATLGYTSFRPGQERAVETLLEKNKLLYVAPTGGQRHAARLLPWFIRRPVTLT